MQPRFVSSCSVIVSLDTDRHLAHPPPTNRPDPQPQAAAQRKAELQPGHYVRVFGHLKSYNGKWTVNAFAVRAIHDFNEVGG